MISLFRRRIAHAFLSATALPAVLGAQGGGPPQAEGAAAARVNWDVTQPRGKTRDIDFTTSEGTWMSADLSPDRTWIAFDLLGHVYRMPVAGGEATVLTQNSGVALNFQPRISPDGKSIAFITDRRGQYNLWVMNAMLFPSGEMRGWKLSATPLFCVRTVASPPATGIR